MHPKPPPPLPDRERAELARQGAKAAARGDPSNANPMDQPQNTPGTTGESPKTWRQRHDAWQAGHSVQSTSQDRHETPPGEQPDEQD
ncbi:CrpP-related protein [Eleftheria terrae]|uniref:CrpP-related protein n=1 Tax=Eleftheria terrae TaxID=1597781 RepID=UPI00263A3FDE|nr:CrpP-related protein [Eleftheria terrae]WKB55431.1 hypothetical protein N7L95_25470 [Eleftheria terrae]